MHVCPPQLHTQTNIRPPSSLLRAVAAGDRLTAAQALQHDWLQGVDCSPITEVGATKVHRSSGSMAIAVEEVGVAAGAGDLQDDVPAWQKYLL